MPLIGKNIGRYKDGREGSHEELWIVSYADMMTLLFGFFVILYSFSNFDETRFNSVSKQLAEAFRGDVKSAETKSEVGQMLEARQIRALQMLVAMLNLGDNVDSAIDKIEKQAAESKNLEVAKAALLDGIESKKDSVVSKLKMTKEDKEDQLEIAIPDGTLFNSGTAELTKEAKTALGRIAQYLMRVKGLAAIEIIGHTDSSPPGKGSLFPNNWALSSARAGSVASELMNNGIPPKSLIVRGMASLEPLFPEKRSNGKWITENMSRNRRVSILIKKNKDAP